VTALQFGLNISTSAEGGADPVAAARRAEELGFDFVSVSDHPCGTQPSFENWTMLTWIAASTTRIRVASRVLGMPYRAPAMVAKMAETLDRLSGGRLILGLGERSAKDKTDGLEEGVTVIRGLWSERSFSFSGRLYRTEEADVEPKPAHRIPIWLGTFAPRALAVTGRLADGWIPSLAFAPPDEVVVLRERVLAAAREAGRDPSEITCAYNVGVRVDEQAEASPSLLAGAPDAVAEELIRFVGLGFSAINFMPSGPDPAEQAERLASEVIPAVRAGA
jgi:alkanesulfonate monooxygenase SsuD/methylene tetrahydromethanopterin reductase-like flavin-dependent oxidoreductase (luciferase family)